MAIKYRRETSQRGLEDPGPRYRTLRLRLQAERHSQRRSFLIVYVAIAALAVFLIVAHGQLGQKLFSMFEAQEGQAQVESKGRIRADGDEERAMVSLALRLADGRIRRLSVYVGEADWRAIETGQILDVKYRMTGRHGALQIIEMARRANAGYGVNLEWNAGADKPGPNGA